MNKITANMETWKLQHIRRTIEAEMLAACAAGIHGTQAHVGQLEMLAACGEELYRRNALLPAPPFIDVNHEDGIRYTIAVRVF